MNFIYQSFYWRIKHGCWISIKKSVSAVTVKLNKLLKQYRRNFPDYCKDRKRYRTV